MTLWQAVIEFIVTCGVTSEPWGRDKSRIEELFAQLYLLGERPSPDDLQAYMRERWPQQRSPWQNEIIKLWRKRLKNPTHQPASVRKATGWSHLFTIPEMLVEKHGLTPIGRQTRRCARRSST